MSTDLLYLTLSAGFCILLWIPNILSRIQTWGLVNAVGYPANPPELPAWAQRSKRVHENMVEKSRAVCRARSERSLSGAANETTALGALIFFWARVVHAIVFTLGIPWLRHHFICYLLNRNIADFCSNHQLATIIYGAVLEPERNFDRAMLRPMVKSWAWRGRASTDWLQ